MNRLRIDIWSDIACPWCYVGKRRLEAALAGFEHQDSVDVVWRSFELDPDAPAEHDASQSYAERLARKYRRTVGEAETMIARMTEVGRAEGLELRFDRVKRVNTFEAHRLIHLAHEQGKQDVVKERLLRAYMTEGEVISERDVLVRLAGDCGLESEAVRTALRGEAFAQDVRADEREARELGITGVPFFVFAERYAASGAQPPEVLANALEQAWRDVNAATSFAEGAACGPDGC
ncbi:MAG TPA: DsbA family oxidoreductase [Polyangiaceae bacterium]|nr:DsbA family oxidoreductase [Polyangiaceae bacterium]